MMAPVMVALYLGMVEVSDGIGIDRKVSLIASTLANLTAQYTTISNERHEQYPRCLVRDHRALFGFQPVDDGDVPEHRCQ